MIIIILLNDLLNHKKYEGFNISNLQDLHYSVLTDIETKFNDILNIKAVNNYPKINVENSKYNENINKKECKCSKLNVNKNQLSNVEFINLLDKIKSRE